jgi:hypothetical protein
VAIAIGHGSDRAPDRLIFIRQIALFAAREFFLPEPGARVLFFIY